MMADIGTSDFLILGSGIAGASAGYFLSGHGRVTLLEGEDAPGYHATGRSAALFTEYYGNRTIRALTRASRAFFEAPPDGFADRPLLHPRGTLTLARPGTEDRFEEMLADARGVCVQASEIGTREALALCPALRPEWFARALHKPDVMDIDVHGLHHAFLRGLKAAGGRIVTGARVVTIDFRDGLWRVGTAAGAIHAARVLVNAAGAWADEVAGLAGLPPAGIVPMRRTAFTFDPPAGEEVARWPMVIDMDDSFYFKPEAGRLLVSPCDETPVPPSDAQPEEIDVATGAARVEESTILKVRRITHRWAGLRSFAADRSPVAGESGEAPRFFWLAGQGGYGIQTAPAMGRVCASLVMSGSLPADVAALGVTAACLSPDRLAPDRRSSAAGNAVSSPLES
jgi:D-arginine dehydrogenase